LFDLACPSAVAALEDDPFYRSISEPFAADTARRRAMLTPYFAYSIQEGRKMGRTVHLADHACGVAVWLLPQPEQTQIQAAREKRSFVQHNLDALGAANYCRIIEFMSGKAEAIVGQDAWYLSIIAIDPASQGRGLGRALLAPTLAEADASNAVSYLETFSARNLPFYERLGFATLAQFDEPTTRAQYAIMVRNPQTR
jgi:GNAT superfamily N-acetyltransferase